MRSATVDDVAAVHALDLRLFGPDAWSEESVREELTGPRRVAVLACDRDGAVVGYVVTSTAGDVVDVHRVAVRPDLRRRGLARLLLATALDAARGERVLLEVAAGNAAGLALYASAGFVEIDVRRGYYRDGSDAVVMERPLPGNRSPA